MFAEWIRIIVLGAAFGVSLFFVGFNVEILCAVVVLLCVWFAFTLWRAPASGVFKPKSIVASLLLAYFLWLAVTLIWSPVSSVSVVTFAWLAVWPLVFFGIMLDSRREEMWRGASRLIMVLLLALAAFGFYQRFMLQQAPDGPFLDRNIYAALLMLGIFPLAGHFLHPNVTKRATLFILTAFFALCFAVALTQGRAAVLTFGLATAIFVAVVWRKERMSRLVVLGATAIAAFTLANISWDGGLVERLATLEHPHESGRMRFLIWESTWRMIMDRPWTGVGLGIYPLLWPPYRHVDDTSGGYFAHNDYLQAWADGGLPAFMLFVSIFFAIAWMILLLARRSSRQMAERVEFAGITAALAVLPINSFFNYNFYIVPSLIVFALLLARLHMLADGPRVDTVMLTIKPSVWRAGLSLLILLVLGYFGSVGVAAVVTNQAVSLARDGKYADADECFTLASRLWPSADSILTLHADLYRHLLAASRSTDAANRAEIFNAANQMLDRAEQLNPVRPHAFFIHAELWRANSALVGADARSAVSRNYAQALALDPWHYQIRFRYASYLLEGGDKAKAREVLEQGMTRARYAVLEDVIPYLLLTADLRTAAGDEQGGAEVRRQAKAIAEARHSHYRHEREERNRLMPHRLSSAF